MWGICAIRQRPGRQRPFQVRWRPAGKVRSRSSFTRTLADSYRAEPVRAARTGRDFDPATGEPAAWNLPAPVTVTWDRHAIAHTAARRPELAAHSQSSLADALATITPALTGQGTRKRPEPRALRTVLYRHGFNPARPAAAGTEAARILDWARRASVPITDLILSPVLTLDAPATAQRSSTGWQGRPHCWKLPCGERPAEPGILTCRTFSDRHDATGTGHGPPHRLTCCR
jgi:hypothetical protein